MCMDTKTVQATITPYLRRYNVTKADLFGSIVRGELTSKSDVDLLVELPREASLLDFIGLKQDLEDALGCSVDLVEYEAIKPRLKQYILQDLYPILPA